jgi:hypothetical protein
MTFEGDTLIEEESMYDAATLLTLSKPITNPSSVDDPDMKTWDARYKELVLKLATLKETIERTKVARSQRRTAEESIKASKVISDFFSSEHHKPNVLTSHR